MAVQKFVQLCPICNLKAAQTSQPRLKPIRSEKVWERIQLDLIDMRSTPCTDDNKIFKWIAHVVDHYSKFHIIWPQEQKTADAVVSGFETRVLSVFGLPKILQCDNGLEFKNETMRACISRWEGKKLILKNKTYSFFRNITIYLNLNLNY